ncbi:MAG: hypothetical protein M0R20_02270 [Candidatus Omnitrophica bacterium]|jgi:hypothetical protein|nr:hypothetical protein [Candidatus Omnitrophota bacterium]
MVVLKDRIFFVSGSDFEGRKLIIENIKKKTLAIGQTSLNVLNFYPKEINIKDLQEKVLLSSFDEKRMLIFKDVYNLSKEVKDFLCNNLDKIVSNNYIVFEAEGDVLKNKKMSADKFFNFIANSARCYKTSLSEPALSFEDFKKSIRQNNAAQAMYVLAKLYQEKSSDSEKKALGLQLIGVLVSEFSCLKDDVSRKKYFNYLWKADRAIKERGFDPRFAIELFLSRNLAG